MGGRPPVKPRCKKRNPLASMQCLRVRETAGLAKSCIFVDLGAIPIEVREPFHTARRIDRAFEQEHRTIESD
jgi:hypothetical protein